MAQNSSAAGRSTRSRSTTKRSNSARSRRNSTQTRRGDDESTSNHRNIPDYSVMNPDDINNAVDVYFDAPVVKVDEIKFEIDDLRAHLALLAELGQFVQLNAGVGVRLGKVELDLKCVETQALMEVRLHHVTKILERVLTTLDRNPELLKSVGEALGDVGGGAHDLLSSTGQTVKQVGKGAGSAVESVGKGAGRGVAGIGQGAERGVEGVGRGAQRGVEGVGQGAEQGLQGVGQGAQQGLQGVGEGAQQAVQGVGQGSQQAAKGLAGG